MECCKITARGVQQFECTMPFMRSQHAAPTIGGIVVTRCAAPRAPGHTAFAYHRLADLRIFGERAARVPRAQPHRVKGEERRARAPVVPGACDNGASQKSRQKAREGLYSAATAERGKESAESLAVNSVVPTVLYMIINMRCDSN